MPCPVGFSTRGARSAYLTSSTPRRENTAGCGASSLVRSTGWAEGGETLRTRHAQTLTDVRQLSELFDAFEPFGFAMIHRSWAVNLRRVREIRPAADSGWEVKLDPPVNRVLPVSRRRVSALWECFAE